MTTETPTKFYGVRAWTRVVPPAIPGHRWVKTWSGSDGWECEYREWPQWFDRNGLRVSTDYVAKKGKRR